MAKKKGWDTFFTWLVLIGALNWGLVAIGFNLVETIFKGISVWIYGLVGIAAVYKLYKMLAKK